MCTGALPSATTHLPTTCTRHLQPAQLRTIGAALAPFRALPHPCPRSPRPQQPYSTAVVAMNSSRNLPSSCGIDGEPQLTVQPTCDKAAAAAAAVAPPSPEPGPGTPAPELADSPTARAAPSTADTESVSGLGDGGLCGGVYDQVIRSGFLGAAACPTPRAASSAGAVTADSAAATAGGGGGAGGPGRGPVRRYLVVLNYVLPEGLPHAWASGKACGMCGRGGCGGAPALNSWKYPEVPHWAAGLLFHLSVLYLALGELLRVAGVGEGRAQLPGCVPGPEQGRYTTCLARAGPQPTRCSACTQAVTLWSTPCSLPTPCSFSNPCAMQHRSESARTAASTACTTNCHPWCPPWRGQQRQGQGQGRNQQLGWARGHNQGQGRRRPPSHRTPERRRRRKQPHPAAQVPALRQVHHPTHSTQRNLLCLGTLRRPYGWRTCPTWCSGTWTRCGPTYGSFTYGMACRSWTCRTTRTPRTLLRPCRCWRRGSSAGRATRRTTRSWCWVSGGEAAGLSNSPAGRACFREFTCLPESTALALPKLQLLDTCMQLGGAGGWEHHARLLSGMPWVLRVPALYRCASTRRLAAPHARI